jgi:predicted  nucleic acid-binding Zn-ribbon protein
MPLTNEDITEVVNELCATKDEFRAFFQKSAASLRIRKIDNEIAALQVAQTEALKPINDRRIELQNQRAALNAALDA